MSTGKPRALRLVDVSRLSRHHEWHLQVDAELRRLHASCEDYAQHKQRQDQRVLELNAQCDALLEALKELTPPMPPADAPCHVGLVPQEKCAHCGRIARARAAIKAVEGTK